ncbi:hypothetical protein ACU4HD_46600 [Cupriavidus basilensis]
MRSAWRRGNASLRRQNCAQEGIAKIEAPSRPAARGADRIRWHFIGSLQSNKTRAVAEAKFDWARHSVEDRLSDCRGEAVGPGPDTLPPLQVCLEINISRCRPGKHGLLPDFR